MEGPSQEPARKKTMGNEKEKGQKEARSGDENEAKSEKANQMQKAKHGKEDIEQKEEMHWEDLVIVKEEPQRITQ